VKDLTEGHHPVMSRPDAVPDFACDGEINNDHAHNDQRDAVEACIPPGRIASRSRWRGAAPGFRAVAVSSAPERAPCLALPAPQ
jgi:hypothetical protein